MTGRVAAEALLRAREAVADAVVAMEFARHPELHRRYGAHGPAKSRQDAGYHLSYLAQAVAVDNPDLFLDYVAWAKVVLAQRRVRWEDLAFHLECMAEAVTARLPPDQAAPAAGLLRLGAARLPEMPAEIPSFIAPEAPHGALAHQYIQALLRGDRQGAADLVLDAVAAGVDVRDVYLHVFQRSQYEIGRLWQENRISVAKEHFCTAATQLIMSRLYPQVFATAPTGGVLVATAVAGDLHELGIRMVADFFQMAGWDTYYLGANTPTAAVVETVAEQGAQVLAVSATIAYHVAQVEALIQAVRTEPRCAGVRVLVGGYPFNRDPELWRTVGADGHARDARAAVDLAAALAAAPGGGR